MERTCGGCTACCKILAIKELNKPAGKRCKHCAPNEGCTIYERRPLSCQYYRCLWLAGLGGEEERPDRKHLILDQTPCPYVPGHTLLNIWETRRGELATQSAYVAAITNLQLEQSVWVMHHPLKGPRLFYIPLGVSVSTAHLVREQCKRIGIRVYYCASRAP
jgi:hypothetical protein